MPSIPPCPNPDAAVEPFRRRAVAVSNTASTRRQRLCRIKNPDNTVCFNLNWLPRNFGTYARKRAWCNTALVTCKRVRGRLGACMCTASDWRASLNTTSSCEGLKLSNAKYEHTSSCVKRAIQRHLMYSKLVLDLKASGTVVPP